MSYDPCASSLLFLLRRIIRSGAAGWAACFRREKAHAFSFLCSAFWFARGSVRKLVTGEIIALRSSLPNQSSYSHSSRLIGEPSLHLRTCTQRKEINKARASNTDERNRIRTSVTGKKKTKARASFFSFFFIYILPSVMDEEAIASCLR